MFGIVDETGILQYGQVFCQYTELDTEQLEDLSRRNYNREERKIVVVGKIVVTKNPCHHPGDLRTFDAVDVPKLRHLVDCIVFPQQGERPHPNEISGSDLDGKYPNHYFPQLMISLFFLFSGDEYAVYWHPDLIPTSENFAPYEYDSQEKPKKLDRPVTRDDIRQVVLEISEQDALGRLSNLHLAFTDKFSIRHRDAMKLAAAIAEEVDAGKTGKHPLTEDEIAELARKLDNERADFFNRPKQFDLYASSNSIGK
jgi:RNA-dependent RNA polymerase